MSAIDDKKLVEAYVEGKFYDCKLWDKGFFNLLNFLNLGEP